MIFTPVLFHTAAHAPIVRHGALEAALGRCTPDSSLELSPKWQQVTCMVWYDARAHFHHAVNYGTSFSYTAAVAHASSTATRIDRASMRDEGGGSLVTTYSTYNG